MTMNDNNEILTEIPPIHNSIDGIFVRNGYKKNFDFPIHRHSAYELNLLINADNSRRIIGDSISKVGGMEMVLLGPNLTHGWKKDECRNNNVYEITIQFVPEVFIDDYLIRFQLMNLHDLLHRSANGVAFGRRSILKFFKDIELLAEMDSGLERLLHLVSLFHKLSDQNDYTQIASPAFTCIPPTMSSRRITKVCRYINEHYSEPLKISDLGNLINMTDSSFSRFFKIHTGTTPTEYITDIRLGAAARLLITNPFQPILEICYSCGFNNVSHFSRIFKQVKGMSPSEFRTQYLS